MKRRDFLIAAAGTTGLVGAGTSGMSRASARAVADGHLPHADEFETVVDAVEAGADPSGETSVNFLFEEHADDETLLAFEPGTYEIDYFSLSDITHLGVVGTGVEPARFVPAAGQCRGGHPWVAFHDVSDLLLEDITFDFRETGAGGPLHLFLEGDSTIRNLTHLGSCSNQIGVLKIDVRDADGTARVENLVARNVGDNQSLTAIYVTSNHAGALTFADCQVANFSDNGLYASAPGKSDGQDGPVYVVGGTYRNNNVAGVRLGTTGARAEDVTVVVDAETPGWGKLNARGIRLRNRADQVIDGCDITFGADAAESFGGIVFHQENGGARVSETTVTIDRDGVPAARTFPVAGPTEGAPVFESCTFTGDAADGVTARIEGRDGTVFRDCMVEGTGDDRRGLHFLDSENCRIVDSRLDVGAVPVAVENGTVDIENTAIVTDNGDRYIEQMTLENEALDMSLEAGIRITDRTVDGTTVTAGTTINPTATVTNAGSATNTVVAQFGLDTNENGVLAADDVLDEVVVEPCATHGTDTVEFTVDTTGIPVGNHTQIVSAGDSSDTTPITVERGSSLPPIAQQYDANNDGVIDTIELGEAVGDYARGEIDITELATILHA